jgi:transposase
MILENLNKKTLKRLYITEKNTLDEISKMFDCSRNTIRNRCREYGIKLRPRGKEIVKLKKSVLLRLYVREGKSMNEIAAMFSCSLSTVRKMCKGYGIRIRDPKRIKGSNKVLRSVYFDIEQMERLNKLSAITRVPQAVYIREGIDFVLNKEERKLRKHKKKKTLSLGEMENWKIKGNSNAFQ